MTAFAKDTFIEDASHRIVFLLVSSDDGETEIVEITPTVEVSINGAAFSAASGSPVEIGNGWYYIDLSSSELGTVGPVIIRAYHASSKVWRSTYEAVAAAPDVTLVDATGVTVDANLKTVDATFDGSNFVFDATALEQVAVYLIRYALANIENSGKDTVGGVTMPTKNKQSLAAAIARLVNDFAVDEINEVLTVYETDGVTEWLTQDITSSATAKPLTSGTTN